tara:strand:- start:1510 stop:1728 length:219 start_codon:yes stop_codon:yes gene_type:complete
MDDATRNMPKGTVKWFNRVKGFGFIEKEDGNDVFVHKSDVESGTLHDGDEVEFELGEAPDGRACAINVNKLE